MKTIERIIIKIILFQFVCLFLVQLLLSFDTQFFHLTKLAQYEGVSNNNYTKVVETFENLGK